MPSFVTHHHFAVLVQQAAGDELSRACEAAPAAYAWGCQGPDPLFFYHAPFGGKIAALGGKMHREGVADAFRAIVSEAAALREPAALAYLLGFCTHYALDRTAHPYIEDQTRLLMARYSLDNSTAHKLCEADIDSAIILNFISAEPAGYPAYKLLDPDTPSRGAIGRLLSAGGRALGEKLTAAEAEDSLTSMHKVYQMLHGGEPTRKFLAFFEKLARKPGGVSVMIRRDDLLPEDSLNEGHRTWLDWAGLTHTASFLELMEGDALRCALSLQQAAFTSYRRGRPLPDSLFALDYSGRRLAAEKPDEPF